MSCSYPNPSASVGKQDVSRTRKGYLDGLWCVFLDERSQPFDSHGRGRGLSLLTRRTNTKNRKYAVYSGDIVHEVYSILQRGIAVYAFR